MSDLWTLIDADLSAYNHTKFSAGGRLYFIKAGRKNVSVYRYHARKNVSIRLSALPEFFFNEETENKLLKALDDISEAEGTGTSINNKNITYIQILQNPNIHLLLYYT